MYTEQDDKQDINNIQTGIIRCTVCEVEGGPKTCECSLVDNVDKSEVLQHCIQQARVLYKAHIRPKYL
jgi:hypothetical protein